jgi:hypothetical protein
LNEKQIEFLLPFWEKDHRGCRGETRHILPFRYAHHQITFTSSVESFITTFLSTISIILSQ